MEFTIFLIVAPTLSLSILPHSHKGGTSSIVISIGHNVPGKQTAWEKTVHKVKLGWSSTPNSSVPFTLFQQDSATGMNLFRTVLYQTHCNQVKKPIERLSVISMHKGLKASCPQNSWWFRCFFLSYFYHINLLTSNSQTWPFLHRPEELERQAQHQPEAQTSLPFLEDAPRHPCMLYSTWIQQCSWQLPSTNGVPCNSLPNPFIVTFKNPVKLYCQRHRENPTSRIHKDLKAWHGLSGHLWKGLLFEAKMKKWKKKMWGAKKVWGRTALCYKKHNSNEENLLVWGGNHLEVVDCHCYVSLATKPEVYTQTLEGATGCQLIGIFPSCLGVPATDCYVGCVFMYTYIGNYMK